MRVLFFPFLLFTWFSCKTKDKPDGGIDTVDKNGTTTQSISYSVTKVYPHDTTSFTEGLLVHEGKLYESTGSPSELLQTRSVFGPIDPKSGAIIAKAELDRLKYFGEGITFLNGKVFQLTYQTRKGFSMMPDPFKKQGSLPFLPKKAGD